MIKLYEVDLHYRQYEEDPAIVQRLERDVDCNSVSCQFHPGLLLVTLEVEVECKEIGSFLCHQKVIDIINEVDPFLGQPVRYTICQK